MSIIQLICEGILLLSSASAAFHIVVPWVGRVSNRVMGRVPSGSCSRCTTEWKGYIPVLDMAYLTGVMMAAATAIERLGSHGEQFTDGHRGRPVYIISGRMEIQGC